MATEEARGVVYWDASALLSVLIADRHTQDARHWLHGGHVHLVSSLAFAEVVAVLGRIARSLQGGAAAAAEAREILLGGPWRWVNAQPDRAIIERSAAGSSLRGADLWHFSLYQTLRETLPELQLLTFDKALLATLRQA